MDSTTAQVEAVRSDEDAPRRGSEQASGADNGEDDGTQKAAVKKRTKTGCLSMSSPLFFSSFSNPDPVVEPGKAGLNIEKQTRSDRSPSLSKAAYQMRRAEAYLQQLYQIEEAVHLRKPACHLQGAHKCLRRPVRSYGLPICPRIWVQCPRGCGRGCCCCKIATAAGPAPHYCSEATCSSRPTAWRSRVWRSVSRVAASHFVLRPIRHELCYTWSLFRLPARTYRLASHVPATNTGTSPSWATSPVALGPAYAVPTGHASTCCATWIRCC